MDWENPDIPAGARPSGGIFAPKTCIGPGKCVDSSTRCARWERQICDLNVADLPPKNRQIAGKVKTLPCKIITPHLLVGGLRDL